MKKTVLLRLAGIGCMILLAALFAFAPEHKWAGRTRNDAEWRIHEELAMVPFHGVFDTLRFELKDRVSKYFSGRASTLLTEIQKETAALRPHADKLGTFARNPQYSWQSHATYLDRVKGHINAVGERIAELQRMRHAVLPWQQQAITGVTSHAAQVAASTQAAILHLRENQNYLFAPEYTDHLTTIADRSEDMKQTVDKFLD